MSAFRIFLGLVLSSIAGIAILISVGLFLRHWPWLFGAPPPLRSEMPAEIDLSIIDWGANPVNMEGYSKIINSKESCATILNALKEGRRSPEHKCTNYGLIVLSYSDGQSVRLGLLPGHHDERYEFRMDHALYSVPRADFLRALGEAEVDMSQIPLSGLFKLRKDTP